MKIFRLALFCSLFSICSVNTGFSQQNKVISSGDNSPIVIANTFSITYGVRADAIHEILNVYEKEGLTVTDRKKRTEHLLKIYQQAPERKNRDAILSEVSKNKLGINNAPAITNALEWDLFAKKNYLSTSGVNSPLVLASGDVFIWYGIPQLALRALTTNLEANKVSIEELETKLQDQVKKFIELKAEFDFYGLTDPIVKKAEKLLKEGKILEVEILLDSDYTASKKRQAYKGFLYGETKQLLLKFDTAAIGYKDAIFLDPNNSKFLEAYAVNECIRGNNYEAITYYEKALAFDTLLYKNEPEKTSEMYSNLGVSWRAQGQYDIAITYLEKALTIDSLNLGVNHKNISRRLNNLGLTWQAKGDNDRAILFFEKALAIDSTDYVSIIPTDISRDFNSLGIAWLAKNKPDTALPFFENALKYGSVAFGDKDPRFATILSNIGRVWQAKKEYTLAANFFEKAIAIDSIAFGTNHPTFALNIYNLGVTWGLRGEYDMAIILLQRAIDISIPFYGKSHPYIKAYSENLSSSYNARGSEFFNKNKYDSALPYFQKALEIAESFDDKNPNIATVLTNLGNTWVKRGEYNTAITLIEKSISIAGKSHPNIKRYILNLSYTANDCGMEFFNKKQYDIALTYFQKALENADLAENVSFSITCLNNIGSSYKNLRCFNEGLDNLDLGITLARGYDQKSGKQEHAGILRRLYYHKLACLVGLNHKKEAKRIAKLLYQNSLEAKDSRTLDDLKADGWIKSH